MVAAARPHGLAVAVDVVAGLHVKDEGQVQHIEPDDGVCAVVAVFVPQARGGQDQIAPAHGTFLAVHGGPGTFAFHHHAHRVGGVAVAGRPFAGHEQLHAQIHGGRGLHLVQAVTGVGQHEHAALGFFNRGEFARLEQQGLDVFVCPTSRLGLASGHFGWQHAAQAGPKGHEVQIAQVLHIVWRQVFDSAKVVHCSSPCIQWCCAASRQLLTFQPYSHSIAS